MKHEFVDDSGRGGLRPFELGKVRLFENDVDVAPTPDLDIVVLADDLAVEGEAPVGRE
jgi:hypothetical protein